ncbi:SRPBCC family protein [Streptomyces sp. TG1A-8]|uniref:SRPBCC family protein n=1 Tax=Streptomyces sp. TG1A-8 TaxID=3051385 RepID=UPI00265C19CA|nr:SRPBCC family protein [Streptomyces sp. TG1A-8]MDO0929280.1 SRPBCC family protein [Streptomyces sp. TG1A-8]
MAVRHRLIKASPARVWEVLADGDRYAEWVVGTASSRELRGRWPQKGASIAYRIRMGPFQVGNETVVRSCRAGSLLELEAKAGPLGTARISIEVREWGEHSLVRVDEHPLQGAGGTLHNMGFEALIRLRHRAMLARLAHVCEEPPREGRREARRGPSARTAGAGGAGHA